MMVVSALVHFKTLVFFLYLADLALNGMGIADLEAHLEGSTVNKRMR
jgi:hypothetical protein